MHGLWARDSEHVAVCGCVKCLSTHYAHVSPQVSNLATVSGFVLCVYINMWVIEGSETAIFLLSPLLLLLSQDHQLFRWLSDQQRYFPIVAAAVIFLVLSAVWHLGMRHSLESVGFLSVTIGEHEHAIANGQWIQAKNAAFLAAVLPQLYIFLRFLFNFKHRNEWLMFCLLPLPFPGMLLADIPTIRLLSVSALVCGIIQMYYTHELRKHGLRFI